MKKWKEKGISSSTALSAVIRKSAIEKTAREKSANEKPRGWILLPSRSRRQVILGNFSRKNLNFPRKFGLEFYEISRKLYISMRLGGRLPDAGEYFQRFSHFKL